MTPLFLCAAGTRNGCVLRDHLNEGGLHAIHRVTKTLEAQPDACWLEGLRLGALHGRFFNKVLALLEQGGSKPLWHSYPLFHLV